MLFLDTADTDAVRRWLRMGVLDGVTTNPTILRRDGVRRVDNHVRMLAELIDPLPLAVEATEAGAGSMLNQCRELAGLARNIVVKVPVVCADGCSNLHLVHDLFAENIAVNVTACFGVGQAYMAAKAGARYVSIFWSRLAEEGGDAPSVVASVRALLDRETMRAQIIVGSVRRSDDITKALLAGTHIVTVPPPVLARWIDHHYARATVEEFERDERERARLAPLSAEAGSARP